MIRLLHYIFLPTAAFITIAGLAWGEWSKVMSLKRVAEEFQKGSDIRVFRYAGMREWQGRERPTYEYDQDGKIFEYPTHAEIDLPVDGRVRVGPDPIPRVVSSIFNFPEPQGVIAVPLNGPDSVETIYKGLRGHEIEEDITKASLVSAAAVIAGFAGFYLQRLIFRGVGTTFRARHSRRPT